MRSAAYEEGYVDGYSGRSNQNPYQRGKSTWREYEEGYREGKLNRKVEGRG